MKKLLTLTLTILMVFGTVSASARELFDDVPETDWAAPYIYNLVDRGVINGYGDGSFGRNNDVLRCEYAKMLVNIAGIYVQQSSVSPYSDVPTTEWYFPYITSSAAYMTGFQSSDGTLYFNPEAPATREAVTVAIVKALRIDVSPYKDSNDYLAGKFSDWSSISSHNRQYIAAAVDKGIITGDQNGTFRPDSPIIRAEVVAVLYRAFPDEHNVTPAVSKSDNSSAVNEKLTAFFLDVGQGDCCFIELPNGETMLIDAGTASSSDYIISFIKDRGYNDIDYVVASHPHADHIGGMSKIFDAFEIKSMYMTQKTSDSKTYKNMLASIENEGCSVNYIEAGTSINTIANVTAEFLSPYRLNFSNLNDTSAVLRLDYLESSYLFSGDAEQLAEYEILSFGRNIDADVLKVGHHGSDTSTSDAYLSAITPNVAVISCGVNNSYGHPHRLTLSKLLNIGASVYRTDTDGTVSVSTNGDDITQDNVVCYGKS